VQQWPAADGPSDEELTALALASDPNTPLGPDAVAWTAGYEQHTRLLPEWYMAPVVATTHRRGVRLVVVALVAGFLILDAFGLCVTSGFVSLA
jgi:hypothetical protein